MKRGFPRQAERNAKIYDLWLKVRDDLSLEAIGQQFKGVGPRGRPMLSRSRVWKIIQDEAKRRGQSVVSA